MNAIFYLYSIKAVPIYKNEEGLEDSRGLSFHNAHSQNIYKIKRCSIRLK